MIFHHELLLRAKDEDAGESVDEEQRTFDFVASSGATIHTRAGAEHLRIGGMDLERFRKNPVVLDSHQRRDSDDVIGTATVTKEGGQLLASVTFARDAKSERVRQKVQDGILRAVSIGFTVAGDSIVDLAEGDTDGEGDEEVRGPAVILGRSQLHELSIVPIPADEDALRRAFHDERVAPEEAPPAPIINLDAERAAAIKSLEGDAALIAARTSKRAAAHAEIRGICPEALGVFLDGLLQTDPDMTFESAKRSLLDERNRTHPPVGTPPPAPLNPEAPAKPTTTGDVHKALTGH